MRRAALILALLSAAPDAGGTVLADWDVEEVLRRADAVVIGVVGAQRLVREAGMPLTETVVQVERALLGQVEAAVLVTQLGGAEASVAGDVRLLPGERVLLALERRGGRSFIVGLALGAWRVEGARATQRIEAPLAGPGGKLRAAPGRREIELAQIEALVRRLAQ